MNKPRRPPRATPRHCMNTPLHEIDSYEVSGVEPDISSCHLLSLAKAVNGPYRRCGVPPWAALTSTLFSSLWRD